MRGDFDGRIARAQTLAARFPESVELLDFYLELAHLQRSIFATVPSTDVRALAANVPALIRIVESSGPDPLIRFARERLCHAAAWENLLIAHWNTRSDGIAEEQFFARVLLQPYAESLAGRADFSTASMSPACPFCSARPAAGVLRGEGNGAKRSLVCSLCATEWLYRRIVCPNCGEEQKDKLPVYLATEIDHVRVEACESCHTYLKSVDLTKDGFAVPEVDEIATVALNLWAEENGYTKLGTNLLGM